MHREPRELLDFEVLSTCEDVLLNCRPSFQAPNLYYLASRPHTHLGHHTVPLAVLTRLKIFQDGRGL
jgi:hypothetical protein